MCQQLKPVGSAKGFLFAEKSRLTDNKLYITVYKLKINLANLLNVWLILITINEWGYNE